MFSLGTIQYQILAVALLVAAAFSIGYVKGSAKAEVEIQKVATEAQEKVAELERQNTEISNKVVTKYVDKVKVVKEKEYVYVNTAENLVPSLVDMSNGWVYLHDISAKNGDADPTRSADATSSGVKDNQAIRTVTENYSICRQNADQLVELQNWIKDNLETINKSENSDGR